jgi:hypothetical protein
MLAVIMGVAARYADARPTLIWFNADRSDRGRIHRARHLSFSSSGIGLALVLRIVLLFRGCGPAVSLLCVLSLALARNSCC